MIRNMRLIESILFYVRQNPEEYTSLEALENECSEDYTDSEVRSHLQLCCDAGFLRMDGPTGGGIEYRLTWKGHHATESPGTTIYGKD